MPAKRRAVLNNLAQFTASPADAIAGKPRPYGPRGAACHMDTKDSVGASLLAMDVNDYAKIQDERGVLETIAGKPAPTSIRDKPGNRQEQIRTPQKLGKPCSYGPRGAACHMDTKDSVGASLLAIGPAQPAFMAPDTPPSGASPFPQGHAINRNQRLKRSTSEYWVFAVRVSSSLRRAEFCACSEVWSASSEMLLMLRLISSATALCSSVAAAI